MYCLSLDLGTSSLKAALVADTGTVIDTQQCGYPVASPAAGWAETPVSEWLTAVVKTMDSLRSRHPSVRPGVVSLTGQMHGLVLGTENGALRPAILWPDSRATNEVIRWQQLHESLIAPLANPIVPGMAGPILDWLSRNEPELIELAQWIVSPKDAIRIMITEGDTVTDPSDASATLLWDLPNARWHTALADFLQLPVHLLPRVVPSKSIIGMTSGRGGLPVDIPVVVGCADTAATLFSLNLDPGEALVNVGTGIQVCQQGAASYSSIQPAHHTFLDAEGKAYAMVAPQNGGLALGRVAEWLHADWPEFYAALDSKPAPGSTVQFDPWISTDRLPHLRVGNRAGWSGAGLATTRQDLLRAALESVAFQVDKALRVLPRRPTSITLSGGGTRDIRMAQLICDTTGIPTHLSSSYDATVIGAGLLGLRALGLDTHTIDKEPPVILEPRIDSGLQDRRDAFHITASW